MTSESHPKMGRKAMVETANGHYFQDLYYRRSGSGPPIIALHGLGASSFSWRHLQTRFEPDHTFYSFDLRGHGKSMSWIGPILIKDQADQICAFIRSQDLRRPVIVGNSLGGGIALLIALNLKRDYTFRVASLILIDSIGFTQKFPLYFSALKSFPWIVRILSSALPHHFLVRKILEQAFFDKKLISLSAVETYAENLNRPNGVQELIATARGMIPDHPNEIMNQFDQIDVPTLLVWGKNDRFVPPYVGIGLNALIPESRLSFIPRCGHLPHEERPEDCGEIISQFLDELIRMGGCQ